MRFLGFASSRATKIYGDLAKIYGASPQFFATVSGLTLDEGHKALMPYISGSHILLYIATIYNQTSFAHILDLTVTTSIR